jgi:hypothetical protein
VDGEYIDIFPAAAQDRIMRIAGNMIQPALFVFYKGNIPADGSQLTGKGKIDFTDRENSISLFSNLLRYGMK